MILFERLLAILLGVTLLPLKTFLIRAPMAVLRPFVLIIGLYVGLFIMLFVPDLPLIIKLIGLVTLPIHFSIMSVFSLIGIATAICAMVVAVIYNAIRGLICGLTEGMSGFWRLWNEESLFNALINTPLNIVYPAEQNNEEIPNLADVIPEDQSPLSPEIAYLSDEEIHEAEMIIERPQENLARDEHGREQLDSLKTRMVRYKEFRALLLLVKSKLSAPDAEEAKNEDVDEPYIDEIFMLTDFSSTPILLVKQYQNPQDGQWHCIPGDSRITDKHQLEQHIGHPGTHPHTREPLRGPFTAYHGMPTRYQWHHLTAQSCNAQELVDNVAEIRALLRSFLANQAVELPHAAAYDWSLGDPVSKNENSIPCADHGGPAIG